MTTDNILNEALRLRIAPQRIAAIHGRIFNVKKLNGIQLRKYLLVMTYIVESYRDALVDKVK